MLLTNQRLDKLAACRVDFDAHSMLNGPCLAPSIDPIAPPPPVQPLHRDLDDDAVDGPQVLASVSLARTRGNATLLYIYSISLMSSYSTQIPSESS
jgi:hypothetical protein